MSEKMQYIHVKQLERYHPGYRDRTLQWAKIYFKMVQGDPDCELIEDEIDWARLIKFIILELEAQRPIPLNDRYLISKGFDLVKRPISLTLQMLHNFIEVIQDLTLPRHVDKEKEEDKDKDKDKEEHVYPYLKNDNFKPLWKDWLEVRKKLKVPNTERALNLALKKLHAEPIEKAIIMLEKAIECGWKGIWPVNELRGFNKGDLKNKSNPGKYDGISEVVTD